MADEEEDRMAIELDLHVDNGEGDGRSSSLEQAKKCWKEYVELGGIFRLSCDLEEASVHFLLSAFQSLSKHDFPKEIELDLCTFPPEDLNGTTAMRLAELLRFLPLQNVEVENRLLEMPWSARTVSTFLDYSGLHRLDKLVLYGVDLRGREIGTSFRGLLGSGDTGQQCCQIAELLTCSCALDRDMLLFFCQGLQRNRSIKTLALYEGGMDPEMLTILVQEGLCSKAGAPQLHSLNLARNQLTYKALRDLTTLLEYQSNLQFFSVSHNVELFLRNRDDDDDVEGEGVAADTSAAAAAAVEEATSSSSVGLNRCSNRSSTWYDLFWKALHRHLNLLHFWAQSPGDPPPTLEDRARPVLQRNAWLALATQQQPIKSLSYSLWPRILDKFRTEPTVLFAFLKLRMDDWMALGNSYPRRRHVDDQHPNDLYLHSYLNPTLRHRRKHKIKCA